jgi:hypothetical protein
VAKSGRWIAKQGDGWLSREMVGLAGRCVAKQGDGWLSREMGD